MPDPNQDPNQPNAPNQPPKPPADVPKEQLSKANVTTPATQSKTGPGAPAVNRPAALGGPGPAGVGGGAPKPTAQPTGTVVNRPSSPTGTIAPAPSPLVAPGNEAQTTHPPKPSASDAGQGEPRSDTHGAAPDTNPIAAADQPRPSTQFPSTPTHVSSTTPMVPPVGTPDYFDHGPIDFNNAAQVQAGLDKYVSVEQLAAGSAYTHKGVCRKCGWQSHQYSEADARESVRTHAQKHLREVR